MEELDIFNVNMDDFEAPSQGSSTSKDNQFIPNPNDAKDKVYTAVVRPLYWLGNPNGFNPKENYIEKKTFYLKNAADEGGYFDSPASIKEKCQAMQAFFKLKKEGKTSERAEELANKIKPKSSFFYLVYVEKDLVNPDNEGKVMVWKAPIQIHRLIDGKVNPDEKAQKLGKTSEDVFNPLTGRSIEVNVSLQKFWNYDGCEWQSPRPLLYKGKEFTPENKAALVEEIKAGDDMMKPFIYTPMSAERKQLLLDIITEKTGITFGKTQVAKKSMEIEGVQDESDASELDSVIDEIETNDSTEEAETAEEVTEGGESNINEFIDGLDLDL